MIERASCQLRELGLLDIGWCRPLKFCKLYCYKRTSSLNMLTKILVSINWYQISGIGDSGPAY